MSSVSKSTKRPSPDDVANIKKNFALFDVDKDNGIDIGEFKQMVGKFGIELGAAEAEDLFKAMDVDGSKKIELGEFIDHWHEIIKRAEAAQEVVKQKLESTTSFTREEINAMHNNFKSISKKIHDDGVIDPDEFKQMMVVGSNIPKWNTVLLDGLFRMFDSNRSGAITFDEFVQSLSIFHGKLKGGCEEQKAQLLFDVYDADQDKKISEADLAKVLSDALKSGGIQLDESYQQELVKGTLQGKALGFDEFRQHVA